MMLLCLKEYSLAQFSVVGRFLEQRWARTGGSAAGDTLTTNRFVDEETEDARVRLI